MNKIKITIVFFLVLLYLCGCSTGHTIPRFEYEGKTFVYTGYNFTEIPDNYQLLGKAQEVLGIPWNYSGAFGGPDAPLYYKTKQGSAVLIPPDGSDEYRIFVPQELAFRDYVFVRGSLYRCEGHLRKKTLPEGFAHYGDIRTVVYDRYPDEELCFFGATEVGTEVYISDQNRDAVYMNTAQNYGDGYYRFDRIP